jgi:hypothetical protein
MAPVDLVSPLSMTSVLQCMRNTFIYLAKTWPPMLLVCTPARNHDGTIRSNDTASFTISQNHNAYILVKYVLAG